MSSLDSARNQERDRAPARWDAQPAGSKAAPGLEDGSGAIIGGRCSPRKISEGEGSARPPSFDRRRWGVRIRIRHPGADPSGGVEEGDVVPGLGPSVAGPGLPVIYSRNASS